MAGANPDVTVNILGNSSGLSGELNKVGQNLSAFKSKAASAGNAASQGLGGGLNAASGAAGGMTASLGPLIGKLAALAAAYMSVSYIVGQAKAALDKGGELSDMSARTGIAAGELMVLGRAFQDAGMSAQQVGPTINLMQRNLMAAENGSKKQAAALAMLGVSMDDLKGKTPSEQMKILGNAIGNLKNPADKTAAAMALFGRSGARMMALFNNPAAMEEAAQSIGNQAALMDKNADAFDRVSDVLNGTGDKVQGLFVGMLSGIIGPLEAAADAFDQIDLSGIGEQIGNVMAILIAAFQEGKLGELFGASLEVAFWGAIDLLYKGAQVFGAVIGEVINQTFAVVADPTFWMGVLELFAGLGNILIGVVPLFSLTLQQKFNQATRSLQEGLLSAVIFIGGQVWAFIQKIPSFLKEHLFALIGGLLQKLAPVADLFGMGDAVRNASAEAYGASEKAWGEGVQVKAITKEEADAKAKASLDFRDDVLQGMIDEAKNRMKQGVEQVKQGGGKLLPIAADVGKAVAGVAGKAMEDAQGFGMGGDAQKRLENVVAGLDVEKIKNAKRKKENKGGETDEESLMAQQQDEAKAKAEADKQAEMELELQKQEAIASGNTALAEKIQMQQDYNKALQAGIDAGMSEAEAQKYAGRVIAANAKAKKDSAKGGKDGVVDSMQAIGGGGGAYRVKTPSILPSTGSEGASPLGGGVGTPNQAADANTATFGGAGEDGGGGVTVISELQKHTGLFETMISLVTRNPQGQQASGGGRLSLYKA